MNTQISQPVTNRHRSSRGFTLIELMVTVAIVAILAAIAIPAYRNYVIRGELVDATQGLAALRANMERYFQDNRTYIGTAPFPNPCSAAYTVGKFTITCVTSPGPPPTFTATATGSPGTAELTGFTYTVNQNDVETTTVAAPAPSAFASCATAWVTKTGGC
jgi:prepilin-type N-terminal cleavage/methylation domain-containing protein